MRRVGSYVGVAVVAAGLSWWAAGLKPVALPAAPAVPPGTTIELTPEEQISVGVYQAVNRCVVNITTHSVVTDDFGIASDAREGSGSGSVLDKKGHIVTNYHVVE